MSSIAWLLAACGGGGGGGGGSTPNGSPQQQDELSKPTFRFGTHYPIEQSSLLSELVISHGGRLVNLAQFTVDITHRFAKPGSPLNVTANCAYSGQISLQLADRDGNGYASAGDTITASLDQCGMPVLARKVSGSLRVDVLATGKSADQSVSARLTVLDALRVSWMEGTPPGMLDSPGTWAGSLRADWSETDTGTALQATSSDTGDWRSTSTTRGVESTAILRQIQVSKQMRFDSATVESSMAFMLDLGSLGGTIKVSSAQPMTGDLNVAPRNFQINAWLADFVLKIERHANRTVTAAQSTLLANLSDASGRVQTIDPEWAPLMRDPRFDREVASYTDQGGGFTALLPWQSNLMEERIDRACAQRTGAGVDAYFHADPLFQRPVASGPGLTEAQALVKIQFGRAIAAGGRDLQFRFVDQATNADRNFPNWSVAAEATRRGAAYEVRPTEPLRMGRQYTLQASKDGLSWTDSIDVKDPQGQTVASISGGTVAQVHTHRPVVASAERSDLFAMDASSPARLRGSAETIDKLGVQRYQWEQLSGPTLRLSAPQNAETEAYVEAPISPSITPAVMQLTVTDKLGRQDRTRVRILVGTTQATGAVLAMRSGYDGYASPWQAYAGEGLISTDAAGLLNLRTRETKDDAASIAIGLSAPVGQALKVGTYANAVRAFRAGPSPALITGVYCNTDGVQAVGWFKVLELAYAADGQLSRLAVDFKQQCDGGQHEYQHGSYRYNSALPVTP